MASSNVTIGFIGYGNMAQAIAQGLVGAGVIDGSQVVATTPHFGSLQAAAERIGARPVRTAAEVVQASDIVVVAVKPKQVEDALAPIVDDLDEDGRFVLSIVGGYTYSWYQDVLKADTHLICAVPNTPIAVGKGILATETTHSLTAEQYRTFKDVFGPVALIEEVPTDQLGIATTVAGCAPAFTAMYMEALADAGVKHGLSRLSAYRLAAQMVEGTGALYLATGTNPGAMKDQVTSPGGTTIKGVAALEKDGFRGAVIDAVDAIEGE
ncbi:Pyrroline-5-carboxylate reductase [Bifidobacterium actinocoloniiforme DSM 22766]|uniref:Pyrroline-5-carboxylate reductase n=1 Tax=Bifidobacterium actinocoloniiforme DSM 22766 TaxID=1437605 RepID=A0A086Z001_9BIFI|nr:pyrroline-5-carboxylate reductase [Bifidobacterium actinocoloniiforme]AKV55122.1 pyrroline-5-carboxylate reductase [Bifidobacterium actinocoloniiforme DSM 22766]KFI39851.1 Pyrroline-5-carboxylate reductase [Bifidobacterium actinocoloniiforme DSM 22766]